VVNAHRVLRPERLGWVACGIKKSLEFPQGLELLALDLSAVPTTCLQVPESLETWVVGFAEHVCAFRVWRPSRVWRPGGWGLTPWTSLAVASHCQQHARFNKVARAPEGDYAFLTVQSTRVQGSAQPQPVGWRLHPPAYRRHC
jgi:hypothetical protein